MTRPSFLSHSRAAALFAGLLTAGLLAAPLAGASARADAPRAAAAQRVVPLVNASFPGTGTGSVPDGGLVSGTCGAGTPGVREVTFAVTGVPGPIADVNVALSLTHSFMGDVRVTLVAPNGASAPIVDRVGADGKDPNDPADCGFGSNYGGSYVFSDTATANPWTALGAAPNNSDVLATGTYRATGPGGPTPVSLTNAFASVTDPTGTWKLVVQDTEQGDTGAIDAATLSLTGKNLVPCQQATASVSAAQQALLKATKAASKAKKKLKAAKKNDASDAKIAKAKKKVKKTKKAKKAAGAALKTAQNQQTAVC